MNSILEQIRALIEKHKVFIIGLNGANGSGKELKGGALYELCTEEFPLGFSMAKIVMSTEIADHIAKNGHLTQALLKARKIQIKGKLVPNGPIFELLWIALYREVVKRKNNVILLDGFPREPRQGKTVAGAPWFSMIYLKTTLKTTLARARKRREDAKAKGLEIREDDLPKVARRRYVEVFLKETLPTIKSIGAARPGCVSTIRATNPVCHQVREMILAVASAIDPKDVYVGLWSRMHHKVWNAEHPIGKRLLKIDGALEPDSQPKPTHRAPKETASSPLEGDIVAHERVLWARPALSPPALRPVDAHRAKLDLLV